MFFYNILTLTKRQNKRIIDMKPQFLCFITSATRKEKTMNKDKVIRQIDNLGRVVIPKDLRIELGIDCGDKIAFETEGDRIIITKPGKNCIFCNSKYELTEHCDKYICRDCLRLISSKKAL